MSVLLIVVSTLELMLVLVSLVVLKIVRMSLMDSSINSSPFKVRRYLGYVMIAITCVSLLDYSYSAYRYFVPADPLQMVTANKSVIIKNLNNCPVTVR